MDGQGTKWLRKIVENFSLFSSMHQRYIRHTDLGRHIANVNVSSGLLKSKGWYV